MRGRGEGRGFGLYRGFLEGGCRTVFEGSRCSRSLFLHSSKSLPNNKADSNYMLLTAQVLRPRITQLNGKIISGMDKKIEIRSITVYWLHCANFLKVLRY